MHVLRRAGGIKQSKCPCCTLTIPENKVQKSFILYLSKVTTGAEDSQFNCGVFLDPSEWRHDSGLCWLWSSLPAEVAFLSGATPSGRSSSGSDCVRDMDRSLALLSDNCTSELGVLTLSHLPDYKHSATYHLFFLNIQKGEIKRFQLSISVKIIKRDITR